METSEMALEEIARLVKEGYTSGILSDYGEGTRTSWELKTNTWDNN